MTTRKNPVRCTFLGGALFAQATSRAPVRAIAEQVPPLSELAYSHALFGEAPLARRADENHRSALSVKGDSRLRPFTTTPTSNLLFLVELTP